MAAFMLGQTNYSFFSTSGQWIDSSWQWHWEYDAYSNCGQPLGPAVEGPYGHFERKFERCVASYTLASSGGVGTLVNVSTSIIAV